MSNNLTIDQLKKSETIDADSINFLYYLNVMCIIMEIKSIKPKLTQKETSKQLVSSDNTIKRYTEDIDMYVHIPEIFTKRELVNKNQPT